MNFQKSLLSLLTLPLLENALFPLLDHRTWQLDTIHGVALTLNRTGIGGVRVSAIWMDRSERQRAEVHPNRAYPNPPKSSHLPAALAAGRFERERTSQRVV